MELFIDIKNKNIKEEDIKELITIDNIFNNKLNINPTEFINLVEFKTGAKILVTFIDEEEETFYIDRFGAFSFNGDDFIGECGIYSFNIEGLEPDTDRGYDVIVEISLKDVYTTELKNKEKVIIFEDEKHFEKEPW